MEQFKGRYRLGSDDIVCEQFDGEVVVLNLATGQYFALNPTASFLLSSLLQGHAIENLLEINTRIFNKQDILSFLQTLCDHNLVAADPTNPPLFPDTNVVQAAQALTEKPLFEVHDDLADLIIADPIHDSDESKGWPYPARLA